MEILVNKWDIVIICKYLIHLDYLISSVFSLNTKPAWTVRIHMMQAKSKILQERYKLISNINGISKWLKDLSIAQSIIFLTERHIAQEC